MRVKRVVAMVMAVCMMGVVPVRAEDQDKAARIAELEKQIAELQAELSELKGEAAEGSVLYEDDRVVIKYAGISGDEKKYEISFEVENLTFCVQRDQRRSVHLIRHSACVRRRMPPSLRASSAAKPAPGSFCFA